MPRYYFVIPDRSFDDPVSFELPDLVAARRRAVVYIGELLKYRPGLLGLDDSVRLQVCDEAERCLFIINVQIIDVQAET